jgi:quercetin dioxygenase-like cupin family protein
MAHNPGVVGQISDACFEINSDDAPGVHFRSIEGVEISDPVLTKIIWPGPKMTVLEHWMSKGQVMPFHRHQSEFVDFLVKGKVKITMAGKQYIGEEHDSWTAVPGVEHSVEALEDSMFQEYFTPPGLIHNDVFLTWGPEENGTAHYFVKQVDAVPKPSPLVEGSDEKVGESAIAPRVMNPGPNTILTLCHCLPGKRAHHVHWHTWLTYMVSGGFTVWMGGKEFQAKPGHYWGAAAGVDHANHSPDHSYVIEFKTPVPQMFQGRLKSWEAPVEQ